MRPTVRFTALFALTALASTTLAACGSGSGSDPDTVKVSFKQSTDNSVKVMDTYLGDIKKQFEKANPGKKVELVPIKAPDSEYYTKLQQMLRSPKTAPDLVYEDTFLINSDITSGYLKPLDEYLAKWKDWDQFVDSAKAAAQGEDGKTYGVPDGTDTRGLWFSKDVFAKAGLPADWQPKTWDEVLDAARTIKEKVPGVTPINVYTGKPAGEAATMQGFEMLLYGTGDSGTDPLYDKGSKKWITAGQGFKDSSPSSRPCTRRSSDRRSPTRSTPTSQRRSAANCCRRASSGSRSTAPGCRRTGWRAAGTSGRSGRRSWGSPPCPPRTGRRRDG